MNPGYIWSFYKQFDIEWDFKTKMFIIIKKTTGNISFISYRLVCKKYYLKKMR